MPAQHVQQQQCPARLHAEPAAQLPCLLAIAAAVLAGLYWGGSKPCSCTPATSVHCCRWIPCYAKRLASPLLSCMAVDGVLVPATDDNLQQMAQHCLEFNTSGLLNVNQRLAVQCSNTSHMGLLAQL
jgi:hypothetical protein